MKTSYKIALTVFGLLAAFALRGGGQERLTKKQQERFQRAINETPFVDIQIADGDESLSAVSKPPFTPTGSAFHLFAYAAPTVSFAGRPDAFNVKDGQYRAEGKCRWYGDAAVWHVVINTPSSQAPLLENGLDTALTSCSYHLYIKMARTGRVVFERGTELRPVKIKSANMLMSMPPPIVMAEPPK